MRTYVGFAGITTAALLIGLTTIPLALSGHAAADASPPLYVSSPNCSDYGPGTQALPFCTLQHAASVVVPGQTIIASEGAGQGYQTVRFTRSGTPSQPITVVYSGSGLRPQMESLAGAVPVIFDKVHDIKVSGLNVTAGNQDGIDVIGSTDITLDGLNVSMNLIPRTITTSAGISVDGTSSNITISRSDLTAYKAGDVKIAPGAAGVVITTNLMDESEYGTPVTVNGATGVHVTSNTLTGWCSDAVDITGSSSAVVENNMIRLAKDSTCATPATAGLSVSAAAAPGVQADYNYFPYSGVGRAYSWAGTTYADVPAFQAATGQGAHDTVMVTSNTVPSGESISIDSADCNAPGELSTDYFGNAHVDVPGVPNTGTGTCYADRGAVEQEDNVGPTFTLGTVKGIAPVSSSVTITSSATSGWGEPVSYTVDFGDGSGPQPVTEGATVDHTYTTPGLYTLAVRAADTGGTVKTETRQAVIGTPAPPKLTLTTGPYTYGSPGSPAADIGGDSAAFTLSAGADYWELASGVIDTGDGSTYKIGTYDWWNHLYSQYGTYPVTLTETDLFGRTSTASAKVTVGEEVDPRAASLDYRATVPAHHTVKLNWVQLNLIPASIAGEATDIRGVALNVAVTNPKRAGSITAYPDGSSRPGDPTVQFNAGRSADNSTTVYTGDGQPVDFYNASTGPVTLTVHTLGLVVDDFGDTYASLTAPVSVLHGMKLAAGKQSAFRVAGVGGIPAKADAAVLNITESGSTAAGSFTAYADKSADPGVHDADWARGQTVTSQVIVPLKDGKVVLRNASKGTATFSAVVAGYYNPGGMGSVLLPQGPRRILKVTLAGRHSMKLAVAGKNGVPASGTSAVALNLQASGATGDGAITAYPDGTNRPAGLVSLSYAKGLTITGSAIVSTESDGAIDLYNSGSKAVTIMVDLTGSYYAY